VLTVLPGTCTGALPDQWVRSEDLLRSVARLLRWLHAASAGFTPSRHPFPPRPVRQDPGRLVFADAYGWTPEGRRRLPQFGAEAAELSLERMEHNARNLGGGWARMWRDGVGEVISRRRQWLEDKRHR
jgi:hypothetical protein